MGVSYAGACSVCCTLYLSLTLDALVAQPCIEKDCTAWIARLPEDIEAVIITAYRVGGWAAVFGLNFPWLKEVDNGRSLVYVQQGRHSWRQHEDE